MPDEKQTRRSRGEGFKFIKVDSGKEMDKESIDSVIRTVATWAVRAYLKDHPELTKPQSAEASPLSPSPKPVASGRLLNVEGLEKYLSIPRATIYSWVSTGKIPAKAIVRLGRSLRFDVKEVDAWVEENKALSRSV